MVVPGGIALVGIVVVATLLAIALIDLYLEARRWEPLGRRLQAWSDQYPLFAAGLAALLGALLGHFFW
jgi:hypothetical protein